MEFRFGAHGVVVSLERPDRFLVLKPSYMEDRWALPGGHVDAGEDARAALERECWEELGVELSIDALTGLYYQPEFEAQLALFRCVLSESAGISLSDEHTGYEWMTIDELRAVMKSEQGDVAVAHALDWDGTVQFGRY